MKQITFYKGIFWYDPEKESLIVKKVACYGNGEALEPCKYSSESIENFDHKVEWAKFPEEITHGHPYNYYPLGLVEIKDNLAVIYLDPVLNTSQLDEKIANEFMLNEKIPVRYITNGSTNYNHLMDYPKHCSMCGKTFDRWDNNENFCIDHYFGYGSKHDTNHLRLDLCVNCLDKMVDWVLPQCKSNPMTHYEDFPNSICFDDIDDESN